MPEKVNIIEWNQLEKRKYYLFLNVYALGTNAVTYPIDVIKTRLQLQRSKCLYRNTFDAIYKTVKHEGFLGLYKGFTISQVSILTGHVYATSYEISREQFSTLQNAVRGFIAGGLAAVVEQTFSNPIDVISQRLMVEGQGQRNKQLNTLKSPKIVRKVLKQHGVAGFYRGFAAAILVEGMWSASWWASYGMSLELLGKVAPDGTSHFVIQGENQLVAVKENEEQRRLRDVKQVKEKLEMKSLASMNNLRQELLTTHNDQVNRMRQDHQREIERLLSISGEYISGGSNSKLTKNPQYHFVKW